MNTAGWLLTESGRQPWIVQGLMKTSHGVSPSVTPTDVWISIASSSPLYLVLGVADAYLMVHYGRKQLEPRVSRGAPRATTSPTRPRTTGSPSSSTRRRA